MTNIQDIRDDGGIPVVALHSSASSKSQWENLTRDLAGQYEVHALNLPGYGSSVSRGTQSGMVAVAEPVLAQIEQLQTPVHLVGHSFGGAVALNAALARPDLVKSLTLYEPAVFHLLENGGSDDAGLLDQLKDVEAVLHQGISNARMQEAMQPFIDFWNGNGAWLAIREYQRQALSQLAPLVADDFRIGFAETWSVKELHGLSTPTQLIMGMDSPAIAQRVTSLIFNEIPSASLAMLPGLGHMAPIYAPEWVNPRIKQHIAQIDRSFKPVLWPHKRAA